MDDVLLGIVLERLEKDPLADEATDLLLAAFESEESLSAQLSGQATARPSADVAGVAPREPAGAHLQSLTVSGFRGISDVAAAARPRADRGRRAHRQRQVELRRGAGGTAHWEATAVEKLSVVWRQGWRSMHHAQKAQITAEFLVEGSGP